MKLVGDFGGNLLRCREKNREEKAALLRKRAGLLRITCPVELSR